MNCGESIMLSAKPRIKETLDPDITTDPEIYGEEPEGLIGRLQTYWQDNLTDILLVIILAGLTVFNFFAEANLATLNFFHLVILLTGYTLGKRFAVLAAFFTILIVWAFILADKSPYLMYLSNYELNLQMTIWSCLLILMGWIGSFLAKTFQKKPEKEPQS